MKIRKFTPGFLLLLADVFLLNLIYLFLISNTLKIDHLQQQYTLYFFFNNIIWLSSFYICGNYTYKPTKFKKLIKVTLSAFAVFLSINFIFFRLTDYIDVKLNLENIFLFGSYLLLSRAIIVSSLLVLDNTGLIRQKVIIIGCDGLTGRLIKQLERKHLLYSIEGVFDDIESCINSNKYPLIGSINDCFDYALKNDIKEIYAVVPVEQDERIHKIAEMAEKNFIRFKMVPQKSARHKQDKANTQYEQELTIVSHDPEPVAAGVKGQILKRSFDVLFSLFVIIFILSWLAPIIALLIKLDSPGPVFFKQLRSGTKNKPFWCYKFRSLHVNDDADHKQVTQNDSRYTRLGKFLRKSSIDELPQFFNVLAGDMSIVGSRPHMLKHTEIYSRLHKKYMRRHYIKPGLTGWAQVNGYRGEIKVDEQLIGRVDHDLWYIENWNFWLDIRIVFQTFSSTFKGDKNAY